MKSQPETVFTLSRQEVAKALGISPSKFEKVQQELEDQHDFPPRLPGLNRWSRPALVRWITQNGRTPANMPAPAQDWEGKFAALEGEFAALEAAYGGDAA